MKHTITHLLSCFLLFAISFQTNAQSSTQYWADIPLNKQASPDRKQWPNTFRAVQINTVKLKQFLHTIPLETTPLQAKAGILFTLPTPDGGLAEFKIVEAPVMTLGLAAKYPEIKTYYGIGLTDKLASLRMDIGPLGFHAQVLSPAGDYYLDPLDLQQNSTALCYFKKDLPEPNNRDACGFAPTIDKDLEQSLKNTNVAQRSHGTELRTYRLALAATGEYTATKGGTVSGALAGMVTSVNRVTGVYEKELAIRMVLIDNTDTLIFTDGATDPYTNDNGGTMLGQNQTTIDNRIGSANYDIGHVFSTGGGGIANLGVPCRNGLKARGVTGLSNPVGDAFDIDYVAHEMGHQFGGNHTFNSNSGSCSGNGNPGTAYEPGSGTTIMAYAGICGTHNISTHSSAYFHTASFDEMVTYTTTSFGNTCPVITPTGNQPPVVNLVDRQYSIPFKTPFKLRAKATDPDSSLVSYCFEEMDKGSFGSPNSPSGNAPIYRSASPNSAPFRYFPKLNNVINNNYTSKGELLPTYARTLHFRVTARDNAPGGGGVSYNDTMIVLQVIDTGTPFKVTSPDSANIWVIGEQRTITWNVSATDQAPINCQGVHLLLSLDGGSTFTDTLAANVPNTGNYTVTVPDTLSETARVVIVAADNVFYDMSNYNFKIVRVDGIAETLSNPALTISPNPSTGFAGATFTGPALGLITFRLLDVLGRPLYQTIIQKQSQTITQQLDLSTYPQGVYLIEVESLQQQKTVKRIFKL